MYKYLKNIIKEENESFIKIFEFEEKIMKEEERSKFLKELENDENLKNEYNLYLKTGKEYSEDKLKEMLFKKDKEIVKYVNRGFKKKKRKL